MARRYSHFGRLWDDPTQEHRRPATIVDYGRFLPVRLHTTKAQGRHPLIYINTTLSTFCVCVGFADTKT